MLNFSASKCEKEEEERDKRRKEGEDNIRDITWTEQENDEKLI